jgi:hypothetical protein
VGTWGAGLFDSDTAQDLLDSLEDLTPTMRAERLRAVLERAPGMTESNPRSAEEEVITAAAIVGIHLPGGDTVEVDEDYPDIPQWLIRPIPAELAALARQALDVALPEDSWWWNSWVNPDDLARITREVDRLKQILAA